MRGCRQNYSMFTKTAASRRRSVIRLDATTILPGINPQYYQPHYFWDPQKNTGSAITRQDQVQIYEELNLNIQCAMTTSFLRRDYQLKDNRLLPFGWTRTGPLKADKTPYIPADYLHETFPVSVGADPAYADGSGTSVVRYEIPLSAFTAKKRNRSPQRCITSRSRRTS